jgi:hypothetical protein
MAAATPEQLHDLALDLQVELEGFRRSLLAASPS